MTPIFLIIQWKEKSNVWKLNRLTQRVWLFLWSLKIIQNSLGIIISFSIWTWKNMRHICFSERKSALERNQILLISEVNGNKLPSSPSTYSILVAKMKEHRNVFTKCFLILLTWQLKAQKWQKRFKKLNWCIPRFDKCCIFTPIFNRGE